MKAFMAIARALADDNRVRVLLALRAGEMCVCQVMELLQLAPSTVSKHLDILYQAGMIDSRKAGRWVYYRLNDNPSPCVRDALEWLSASLGKDPQARDDAKRAKAVLKMDKETLCCRYGRNQQND